MSEMSDEVRKANEAHMKKYIEEFIKNGGATTKPCYGITDCFAKRISADDRTGKITFEQIPANAIFINAMK